MSEDQFSHSRVGQMTVDVASNGNDLAPIDFTVEY